MADRKTVRPVDASGLVLIRSAANGDPEVLLGRRHRKSGFLPDVFVVPGGRVEPIDLVPTGMEELLHPSVTASLRTAAAARPAIAFARCALRETFEETGLMVGRATAGRIVQTEPEPWRQFHMRGIRPAFSAMDFIFRAITPVASPKRFNTRFFMADGALANGELRGDGELEDLGWHTFSSLGDLPLVDVTQALLKEALSRWSNRTKIGTKRYILLIYKNNKATIRIPGGTRKRSSDRTAT